MKNKLPDKIKLTGESVTAINHPIGYLAEIGPKQTECCERCEKTEEEKNFLVETKLGHNCPCPCHKKEEPPQ